jgi:PBSX family phage terminase large subunit
MIISPSNTTLAQYDFATADPKTVRYPAIKGGFGSGKTRAIPLRWLYLIDWRGKNQGKKCRLMVVEPTYELIRDVAVPTFDEFFDEHKIKHSYHKTNHDYTIKYRGKKFVCMLRSYDNPASLTGKTITDAIIDEFDKAGNIQTQKDVWKECNSRIRGCEFATLGVVTTPEGYLLTYKLWCEDNPDNPQFKLITAKTYDNQFLPADYIAGLYNEYDSLLVKRYIEGEFVNLNNMACYYAFNRDKNVKAVAFDINLPIYVGMDFNVNPMTAVLCHWIDGKLKVFGEYYIPNSNTRKMGELIVSDYPKSVLMAMPDMTGGSRKASAEFTDLQILQGLGFQIVGQRNIAERDRINIVNNGLEKERIIIDPCCKYTIRDLEQVTTNDYGQIVKKPGDPLTHISDALGYPCVQLLPERPKGYHF